MKFIPLGDKHAEYDFFEDTLPQHESGKPRKGPSYLDTAKKLKPRRKSINQP